MTIPTISTLPTAPARTDAPATFISRADAFLAALVTMQGELNTSIGAMNTDIGGIAANVTAAEAAQTAAELAETNAEAAQAAAEAASNATLWVSGTSYSAGDVVYSPVDYKSYRANTATSGTTDPSASADWTKLTYALPSQSGNAGFYLTTDGTNESWGEVSAGGSWTLIETLSPSAASTIDIESFSSAYDIYKIICTLQGSTAAVIRVRFKIGGSYKTSGYKYSNIILNPNNGNTFINNAATNADYIQPSNSSTTLYKGAEFTIYNANQSQRQIVNFNICNEVSLAPETLFGSGGYMAATGAIEGFRIFPNAGGFTGKVHVYGLTASGA